MSEEERQLHWSTLADQYNIDRATVYRAKKRGYFVKNYHTKVVKNKIDSSLITQSVLTTTTQMLQRAYRLDKQTADDYVMSAVENLLVYGAHTVPTKDSIGKAIYLRARSYVTRKKELQLLDWQF